MHIPLALSDFLEDSFEDILLVEARVDEEGDKPDRLISMEVVEVVAETADESVVGLRVSPRVINVDLEKIKEVVARHIHRLESALQQGRSHHEQLLAEDGRLVLLGVVSVECANDLIWELVAWNRIGEDSIDRFFQDFLVLDNNVFRSLVEAEQMVNVVIFGLDSLPFLVPQDDKGLLVGLLNVLLLDPALETRPLRVVVVEIVDDGLCDDPQIFLLSVVHQVLPVDVLILEQVHEDFLLLAGETLISVGRDSADVLVGSLLGDVFVVEVLSHDALVKGEGPLEDDLALLILLDRVEKLFHTRLVRRGSIELS